MRNVKFNRQLHMYTYTLTLFLSVSNEDPEAGIMSDLTAACTFRPQMSLCMNLKLRKVCQVSSLFCCLLQCTPYSDTVIEKTQSSPSDRVVPRVGQEVWQDPVLGVTWSLAQCVWGWQTRFPVHVKIRLLTFWIQRKVPSSSPGHISKLLKRSPVHTQGQRGRP